MAITSTKAHRIRGITSCVPARAFDNGADATGFTQEEVNAIVKMAGIRTRYMADDATCSSDLCLAAARDVMAAVEWSPDSVDGLVMVTQSPDYFQPSTACLLQKDLGLPESCAAFDVGMGCSGYAYGFWIASMMLQNTGFRRVLLLHGETPTRFTDPTDRSLALLFGDAGTATALEVSDGNSDKQWWYNVQTDGTGYRDLIIPGGGFRDRFPAESGKHFLKMNGANIMNFTLKRVPPLIDETLRAANMDRSSIDYYIFHQSNQFIMRRLAKKCNLPEERIPFTLREFGNTGGPSVPLTITNGNLRRPEDRALELLIVAYGVGLSWGSALVDLPADACLNHMQLPPQDSVAAAGL